MRQEPITACCVTVPRLNNLKRLVPKVLPYVDKFVLVLGRPDSQVEEFLQTIGPKIQAVHFPWRDNFAQSYTQYLKHVPYGWFVALDDDEVPSEDMLKSFDPLVNGADFGTNYCCIEYRANPIYIDIEGKEHDPGPCDYYRQMLIRKTPHMHYRGGPKSGMHQYLHGHQNGRLLRRNEVYYHIKSVSDEHRNAARNFWIASIWKHGTREGEPCPEWEELRRIVAEEYSTVEAFMDLDDILIKGNVSQRLKDWMINTYNNHRNNPLMNEGKAVCSYYYKFLHSEEAPTALKID